MGQFKRALFFPTEGRKGKGFACDAQHPNAWSYRSGFPTRISRGPVRGFINPRPMRSTGERMDNMEQLQVVVNEVQSARQQLANLRAQVLELETTLESVKTQPADLALHQQMGGVMVEVSDREALAKELEQTLKALKEHLERFAGREA